MVGMQIGVVAVIANVVYKMIQDVLKMKDWVTTLILIGSFMAAVFFDINVILIIFVAGTLGFINNILRLRRRR